MKKGLKDGGMDWGKPKAAEKVDGKGAKGSAVDIAKEAVRVFFFTSLPPNQYQLWELIDCFSLNHPSRRP